MPSKYHLQFEANCDSIDDGHYPRIKAYYEYEREDLNKLLAQNRLDEVAKVIGSIESGKPTGQPEFITYLASMIHDRSHEHILLLHEKLVESGITPSTLAMNYFI